MRELHKAIRHHGRIMELAAPYTPEQNGVAKHINWTIIEKAKAMLFSMNLPLKLWPEVIYIAVYLQNWILVKGADKTPEEL